VFIFEDSLQFMKCNHNHYDFTTTTTITTTTTGTTTSTAVVLRSSSHMRIISLNKMLVHLYQIRMPESYMISSQLSSKCRLQLHWGMLLMHTSKNLYPNTVSIDMHEHFSVLPVIRLVLGTFSWEVLGKYSQDWATKNILRTVQLHNMWEKVCHSGLTVGGGGWVSLSYCFLICLWLGAAKMHLLILPCQSVWPNAVVTQELLSGFSYCDYIKGLLHGIPVPLHSAHTSQVILCSHNTDIVCTTSMYPHWTECVILSKNWLWLPEDGFLVNRNMLEQPS